MRIVLDTNVLIAAFITRGVCSDLLEHCLRQHEIILSEFILDEFRRHLLHKFNYDRADVEEAVELLRQKAQVVVPIPPAQPVCRDRDDDIILGTAIAGDAACIITGDQDLLVLSRFGSIHILRPAEFLEYEITAYARK